MESLHTSYTISLQVPDDVADFDLDKLLYEGSPEVGVGGTGRGGEEASKTGGGGGGEENGIGSANSSDTLVNIFFCALLSSFHAN